MYKPLIAITMGDPCGIGPEIIAAALARHDLGSLCRPLICGDPAAMARGLATSGVQLEIVEIEASEMPAAPPPGTLFLQPLSGLTADDMLYGAPTQSTGAAVYRYITTAAELCLSGAADAMATAPINKEALNRAGHHYPGHTELLAELTCADNYVMMLAGETLRVALVTIHEPLARVPELVTTERVLTTIRTTAQDLARYFVPNPRLAVLSLNPHAGEGGLFGREEETVITPAIVAARAEGIDAVGPLSADTLFHFAAKGAYDGVICMYHDQGLIPLKLLHFDDGVNVTLGLPIIRTSVDHGTAYDVAGKGVASEMSMVAAIRMAASMAMTRKQQRP